MWREPGLKGKDGLRSKSFDRSADAKAYASKMESEIERRGVGDAERHTTDRYLKRWLKTLEDRGEHSPTTLDSYSDCVTVARPWIGDIFLSKLSPADLDSAYGKLLKQGGRGRDGNTRPLSARTVLNIHRCLHTAL
jgi:hypothetical protein